MKNILLLIVATICICHLIAHSDWQIERLLNSTHTTNQVKGAYRAGESGNKIFIPLLLKNADDPSTSTNISFYGATVYQQKMLALQKIFKQAPPTPISDKPDSVVIKFYIELAKQQQ